MEEQRAAQRAAIEAILADQEASKALIDWMYGGEDSCTSPLLEFLAKSHTIPSRLLVPAIAAAKVDTEPHDGILCVGKESGTVNDYLFSVGQPPVIEAFHLCGHPIYGPNEMQHDSGFEFCWVEGKKDYTLMSRLYWMAQHGYFSTSPEVPLPESFVHDATSFLSDHAQEPESADVRLFLRVALTEGPLSYSLNNQLELRRSVPEIAYLAENVGNGAVLRCTSARKRTRD